MLSQRQLFLQHVAQTSPSPLLLEIERASGLYLYTPEGRPYLDLISGIGVSNLGHCHPRVVEAVKEQAGKYMHLMVYGEYVQHPQVKLATRLAGLLPESLGSVYFVNSGSEAAEGAMKLARRYTGRKKIIAMRNAYHGSTQGALSLMSNTVFTEAFQPLLPNISFIDFNDEAALSAIDKETACVFAETIQGEAGYIPPIPGYLEKLRKACSAAGALLVSDEIQCGFGRTGKLFAFEHYNFVPDILLLAKGMGGGMPIGAFISSPVIMKCLTHDPVLGHITTFGGHPVSCAASLATLETLLDEKLIETVAAKEQLFRELLAHPAVKQIRGRGLMLAVELAGPEAVQQVISGLLEAGIITDWFLHAPDCLRIAPPLIISETEIRVVCETMRGAFDRLS